MIQENLLNDLKNKVEGLGGRDFSLISGVSGKTFISICEDPQISNAVLTDGYTLTEVDDSDDCFGDKINKESGIVGESLECPKILICVLHLKLDQCLELLMMLL